MMQTTEQLYANKRMLDGEELCNYLGLGRNRARDFAKSLGADRHYGRRVVYDRVIIDRAIDSGHQWKPAAAAEGAEE